MDDPGLLVFADGEMLNPAGFQWSASGVNVSSDGIDGGNLIRITEDLYIEPTPSENSRSFAVIPREGSPEEVPETTGATATSFGPALADHLAQNPELLKAFFKGRLGDASPPIAHPNLVGWNTHQPAHADIVWNIEDGTVITVDAQDFPGSDLATRTRVALDHVFRETTLVSSVEINDLVAQYGLDSTGELDLNTGDELTVQDLGVEFVPESGKSVTLSGEGLIRLEAQVRGRRASITSEGSIAIVGAGTDLSAAANVEDGVNLYAQRDIRLSTLQEVNPGEFAFQPIRLRGLVYAWGDFKANLASQDASIPRGDFLLEGTLVAFVGDPNEGIPSTRDRGQVIIRAESSRLRYDPAYLLNVLRTLPTNLEFTRTSWTHYR